MSRPAARRRQSSPLRRTGLPLLAGLLCLVPFAGPALAAQDDDNCNNYITALPATITTQGTWCLAQDLVSPVEQSGQTLVTVDANNVVIDCNHFMIDALPHGPGTGSYGIYAPNRNNLVVRNCVLRGMNIPVFVYGDGAVVEHNLMLQSRNRGMYLQGDNNTARFNRIIDTGGSTTNLSWALGISAFGDADIHDNLIDGLTATPGGGFWASGIAVNNTGEGPQARMSIQRNRIRGLVSDTGQQSTAILVYYRGSVVIRDNLVYGPGDGHLGIHCQDAVASDVRGNLVLGASMPLVGCADDGGNTLKP